MRVSRYYNLFSNIRSYTTRVSKPDVVFLPGMLCDHRIWFEVARMIEPHVNTITLSLNHCKTIDDAYDSITSLSPNVFCLVGFSMGGYIAQEYVLRNPEKVSHLVLAGVRACAYTDDEKQARYPLIEKAKKGLFKGFTKKNFQDWVHKKHVESEIITLLDSMAREAGINTFICQQSLLLTRPDLRQRLQQINCPTLVVGGNDDSIVLPEKIAELANCIPNAALHLIPECGHYSPLENSNEFASQLIKFLQDFNYTDRFRVK